MRHRLIELGFLSTLSLRRATVTVLGIQHRVGISIHALLAESDKSLLTRVVNSTDFYPRSPCGERQPSKTRRLTNLMISIHALLAESDYILCAVSVQVRGFLSTLSLRRATHDNLIRLQQAVFLSTLSLRRATVILRVILRPYAFLSTLSLRRATGGYGCAYLYLIISIHALLAESDHSRGLNKAEVINFYPRSPCGERRQSA